MPSIFNGKEKAILIPRIVEPFEIQKIGNSKIRVNSGAIFILGDTYILESQEFEVSKDDLIAITINEFEPRNSEGLFFIATEGTENYMRDELGNIDDGNGGVSTSTSTLLPFKAGLDSIAAPKITVTQNLSSYGFSAELGKITNISPLRIIQNNFGPISILPSLVDGSQFCFGGGTFIPTEVKLRWLLS